MSRTDTIKVLSDRDKVRERPGMYIGDTGELGLSTIVREIIDNAVDEYANYSDKTKPIIITLKADGGLSVRDYGRGISPYESKENPGQLEHRLAYTILGAGGKFKSNRKDNGNMFAGGLNGVGAAATNAMSEYFEVQIWKDGNYFYDRFENGGIPVIELEKGQLPFEKQTGTIETGTCVTFKPDPTAMRVTKINAEQVSLLLKQTAYLNPGMTIYFTNERDGETEPEVYYSENGIIDYILKIAETDDFLMGPFLVEGFVDEKVKKSQQGDLVDISMKMNVAVAFSNTEDYAAEAFTNGIYNSLGGRHLNGLYAGLVKVIRHYYEVFKSDIETRNKAKIDLISKVYNTKDIMSLIRPTDVSKKVFVVLDFKHSDPELAPQTKDKLVSEEAKNAVENMFYVNATSILDKHVQEIHKLIDFLINELVDKAKDFDSKAKIDKKTETLAISSKLAAARSNKSELNAIWLVEGDSAAGSMKKKRDPNHQAILPLRGKIINVAKATLAKSLANEEVSSIFAVLGAGWGSSYDEKKLKYDKIIIATDQDVDGLHIRVLLITLFAKYMPELILNGHVYILQTPLYVNLLTNKEKVYIYSEDEQEAYLKTNRALVKEIRRKKGLGELEVDEVVPTCLDLTTAKIQQLSVSDVDEMYDALDQLMGTSPAHRRKLIMG